MPYLAMAVTIFRGVTHTKPTCSDAITIQGWRGDGAYGTLSMYARWGVASDPPTHSIVVKEVLLPRMPLCAFAG